jgi:hypothetical protein
MEGRILHFPGGVTGIVGGTPFACVRMVDAAVSFIDTGEAAGESNDMVFLLVLPRRAA